MARGGGRARGRRERAPEWLETGVPNLDRILGGGIRRGAILMVIGAPGTGKTMLAQQIAFHGAARGRPVLYLTGYSETNEKLVAHSQGLSFFAPELIGEQIRFVSLPDLLQAGAAETEEAIIATVRERRAELVVLDGFRSMRRFLADDLAVAHFLYSLAAKLALVGATTLVTTEVDPEAAALSPELAVCDLILALRRERRGDRHGRTLEVMKVRGAAPLDGVHSFGIDERGISVFPRLESVVSPTAAASVGGRAGVGITDVDALLGGGLTVGTVTLVAGGPGVGKTLLGLHFALEGVRAGEQTLVLGFIESAVQLRQKAAAFGLDLEAAEATGRIRLVVLPGYDLDVDRVAELLRGEVESRGVRRLVIDSAAELERGIVAPARKPDYLAALVSYLRGRDVTTCVMLDVPTVVGQELDLASSPMSVLAENLLLLRHVEYRGQLHRVLSVLKMRFSDHDRRIHEFQIQSGHGIRLLGPAPLAAGLLTGAARVPERGRQDPTARRRPRRQPGRAAE